MKLPIFPFLLLTITALQGRSGAAVLANWDFSGIPAADVLLENLAQPHPLLVSTNANAASGLSASNLDHLGLVYSTAVAPGGVGTSVGGELNIKNFDVGSNGSNENYIFFTLMADPGKTLNLDSIVINLWRNGTGAPNGMAFDVSVDSGAFQLYDGIRVQNATGAGSAGPIAFTQPIVGANTLDIRFTPRNAGAGGTGNIHISGLTVNGSVVPEPTASLLVLSGLASVWMVRRRL